MTGKLFIISAPSGAGKTSLTRALAANNDDVIMSVSHTTRQRRADEVHGQDYFYTDQPEFLKMVDEGIFLEYAQVYGNYYGTSKLAVQNFLTKGLNVLLDIDWQGARNVRSAIPEAISISILPPSIKELERRLRSRGSDSEDVISNRMRQAVDEMKHCSESDFVIVNDNFNDALDDLSLILVGQSDRLRPLTVDIDQLLSSELGWCKFEIKII